MRGARCSLRPTVPLPLGPPPTPASPPPRTDGAAVFSDLSTAPGVRAPDNCSPGASAAPPHAPARLHTAARSPPWPCRTGCHDLSLRLSLHLSCFSCLKALSSPSNGLVPSCARDPLGGDPLAQAPVCLALLPGLRPAPPLGLPSPGGWDPPHGLGQVPDEASPSVRPDLGQQATATDSMSSGQLQPVSGTFPDMGLPPWHRPHPGPSGPRAAVAVAAATSWPSPPPGPWGLFLQLLLPPPARPPAHTRDSQVAPGALRASPERRRLRAGRRSRAWPPVTVTIGAVGGHGQEINRRRVCACSFDPPGPMSAGMSCEVLVTFKPMVSGGSGRGCEAGTAAPPGLGPGWGSRRPLAVVSQMPLLTFLPAGGTRLPGAPVPPSGPSSRQAAGRAAGHHGESPTPCPSLGFYFSGRKGPGGKDLVSGADRPVFRPPEVLHQAVLRASQAEWRGPGGEQGGGVPLGCSWCPPCPETHPMLGGAQTQGPGSGSPRPSLCTLAPHLVAASTASSVRLGFLTTGSLRLGPVHPFCHPLLPAAATGLAVVRACGPHSVRPNHPVSVGLTRPTASRPTASRPSFLTERQPIQFSPVPAPLWRPLPRFCGERGRCLLEALTPPPPNTFLEAGSLGPAPTSHFPGNAALFTRLPALPTTWSGSPPASSRAVLAGLLLLTGWGAPPGAQPLAAACPLGRRPGSALSGRLCRLLRSRLREGSVSWAAAPHQAPGVGIPPAHRRLFVRLTVLAFH